MDHASSVQTSEDSRHHPREVPSFVDWLLGAIVIVGGVLFIVAGALLLVGIDRDALEQTILTEEIETTIFLTELSEEEISLMAATTVSASGIGLIIAGIAIFGFGFIYIIYRYWVRRNRAADEYVRSYGTYAVLGAVISVAVSFIPFSTVIGGGVAGYLEQQESNRTVSVGGLAGILPTLPVVIVAIVVLGGLVFTVSDFDGTSFLVLLIGVSVLSLLVLIILAACLGAIGGYLGGKIAEARQTG